MKSFWLLLGVGVFLFACGGGGAPPQGNPDGNPRQGNEEPIFIPIQLQASTTEVNPGEIVEIKAMTGVAQAVFSWQSEGGNILAVLEGMESGQSFSIAWWKAPLLPGAQARVQVVVNSPSGSSSSAVILQLTPSGGILSEWKTFHGNPEHTGLASADAPAPESLNLAWKLPLNDVSRTPPAIAKEGMLYIADLSGTAWAVDTVQGKVVWSKVLDNDVAASPVIASGKVFFATLAGTVYALDARTGEELWNFSTGSPILSSPAYLGGLLFVVNERGVIYALRTQKVVLNRAARIWWQKSFTGEFFAAGITPMEAQHPFEDVRSSLILVTSREGYIRALRSFDGAVVWEKDLKQPVVSTPISFALGAQRLAGWNTEKGQIYLLDGWTGAPFKGRFPYLRMDAPAASSMVFQNPLLIFPSRDNRIFGLNLLTETAELNLVLPPNTLCSSTPAIRPVIGRMLPDLYFTCVEIHEDNVPIVGEFSKARGLTIRIAKLPGVPEPAIASEYFTGFVQKSLLPTFVEHPTVSAPAIQGGMLFFAGLDKALYALGPLPPSSVPSPSAWLLKRLDGQGTSFYPPSPGRGQLFLKWTFDTRAEVFSSPIVVNNTVFITTGVGQQGRLIALRAHDGILLRVFEAPNVIYNTPLFLNNDIVFSTRDAEWLWLREEQDRISSIARFPLFDFLLRTFTSTQREADEPPITTARQSRDVVPPGDAVQSFLRSITPFSLISGEMYVIRTSRSQTQINDITYADQTRETTCRINDPGIGLFPLTTGNTRFTSPYIPYSSVGYYPAEDLALMVAKSSSYCQYFCRAGAFFFQVTESPLYFIAVGPTTRDFQASCLTEAEGRSFPTNVEWAIVIPGVIPSVGQPTVYQNYAFFGTREGDFYIVNLAPGIANPQARILYSERFPGGIHSTIPVVWDEERQTLFAFITVDNGILYAKSIRFTPGGISVEPAWLFATVSPLFGSPAVDYESKVVYFGGTDATLYALDMITGTRLWSFTNPLLARFIASPVVIGGWVFITDEAGRVYALSK